MLIEHHLEIEHNFQNIFCEKSFKECLSEEDFQKYLDGKKTITISKGKLVFKEGEIPKGVFYIEKGAVKNRNSFLSNIGLNLGHALASFAT